MKLTALISDKLISEVMKVSKAKNITEALKIALSEYLSIQKLKASSKLIAAEPLEFYYTADELRKNNNS